MYRIASHRAARTTAADAPQGTVRLQLAGRDFVFAQTTIVSSVATEQNGFSITPDTSRFVNSNGDGWTNEALRANYKSFIGAFNFVNHVQEPDLAVGFIADAVLRRRILDPNTNVFVYYVDILVATHRKTHPELCEKIAAGKIEYLSMGCESFMSTCSACGHQAEDEIQFCEHLAFQKGKFFLDRFGKKRVICELLGTKDAGSVEFYEASWLTEVPAFGGAVKRNLLPVGADQTVEIMMPSAAAQKPAVKKFTAISADE